MFLQARNGIESFLLRILYCAFWNVSVEIVVSIVLS